MFFIKEHFWGPHLTACRSQLPSHGSESLDGILPTIPPGNSPKEHLLKKQIYASTWLSDF